MRSKERPLRDSLCTLVFSFSEVIATDFEFSKLSSEDLSTDKNGT